MTTPNNNETAIHKLITDVELLKREVQSHNLIYNKLDTTIEKLRELAGSMNSMLDRHEQRFKNQEASSDRLQDRLTQEQKEIKGDLEKYQERTENKIDNIAKEVSVLNRWKWIVFGGAVILMFVIERIDFSKISSFLH